MTPNDHAPPDWIEANTAAMLARAKRSQFFSNVIADAKAIQATDSVAWDVALSISVRYWCSPLPY